MMKSAPKRKVTVVATAHTVIAAAVAVIKLERQKYMDLIIYNEHRCPANLQMGVVVFQRLCTLIGNQGILHKQL